jgi:peptidoglycan-associated lipoprotein
MRRTVVLLAMTTVLLAACRKKPPEVAPTPTTPTPSAQPTMNLDSLRRAQAMADSLRRAEDASRMGRDASERARAALVQTVYFEYDEAGIRDDARQALDAKVPVLRSNPGVRMTIEGHADASARSGRWTPDRTTTRMPGTAGRSSGSRVAATT